MHILADSHTAPLGPSGVGKHLHQRARACTAAYPRDVVVRRKRP